jgi:quercetin dioxygenase-like cupin family protein
VTGPELVARLVADGTIGSADRALGMSSWSNGAGDRYAAHEHGYDKALAAVSGSIVFTLPQSGDEIELRAGDRLDLPSGTRHGALVGSDGVACVEAHLPPGSLASRAVRRGWVALETGRAEGS